MVLVLFKVDNEYFKIKKASNKEMEVLGYFLIDDAVFAKDFFKDWANNIKQKETSGNISLLEKENEKIIIRYFFSSKDEPHFVTAKEKFIKMLEDWDVTIKQKPDQIFVTIDDVGNITIEGSND